MSCPTGREIAQLPGRIIQRGMHSCRVPEQAIADRGQHQALRRPLEHPRVELPFETRDAFCQRRLSQAEVRRGASQMARDRGVPEVSEVTWFDR
jgi:hypothetical protein